jgi:hypothetical protein
MHLNLYFYGFHKIHREREIIIIIMDKYIRPIGSKFQGGRRVHN